MRHRRPRSSLLLACLAATALPQLTPAPAQAAEDPAISSFTLPNGMMGVVIEDHRAPVVTSMVWYKVGAADDPAGQSGLAHFLEHMMFKATGSAAEGEFSATVAANGGDDNAFTAADYTAYYQRISRDRLDLVLGMEADRMVNLDPGTDRVTAERDVVIEERRMRTDNSPDGPFMERLNATLYLNSPYGRPIIGWKQEMEGFTLDRAMAFYRAHYAPNNAILVVAGDVTPAEVEALATTHFGPIPASDLIAPRARPQEPPALAARRMEMSDPRVTEANFSRVYLAPQRKPGDQKQAAALTVLSKVLGGGITSAMGRSLMLEQGLAIDCGAYYSDVSLDPRAFSLYMIVKPGVDPALAEARLDALLADFIANGPDLDRLARLKSQIAAAMVYAKDDQENRANEVGEALTSGLTLQDVADWPEELLAVTADDLRAAAKAVFVPENSVTAWLMPPEATEQPGAPTAAAESDPATGKVIR